MKLFLRDFDAEALAAGGIVPPQATASLPQAPRGPTPEELERLLIDTREGALAEGRKEGAASARAEVEASQTARIAATLEAVRDQLSQVLAQDAARRRALERDVVDMLVDIGERIAPEFLAAHSADLARARIRDGLRLAGGSPYLNIRVSPGLEQAIAADLAGLAQGSDAQPRLCADPALHDGEVRLDWENGGLDYSLDRACDTVLSAFREAAAKLNDDQGKVG
ncbi:MAG: FliH/SctL family protein [Pseudodonghicola sp.]|nr:FliH/SctL family protein [Pseudodonghicola sp.]